MSDTFDHYGDALDDMFNRERDDPDFDYFYDCGYRRLRPRSNSCHRCSASGLHWQKVVAHDGRSETPTLFDASGRRHVCTPSADDFEVVG